MTVEYAILAVAAPTILYFGWIAWRIFQEIE